VASLNEDSGVKMGEDEASRAFFMISRCIFETYTYSYCRRPCHGSGTARW
jgi:hypothetical protein